MKCTQFGPLLFLAGFPAPILAETLVPPAQNKYFELGAELLSQEAPGLRLSGAYLMNTDLPALGSKIGLDLGVQFFDDEDGTIAAPEYGFFLESALFATTAFKGYMKTGVYTLVFPKGQASESSMSSVGIEFGMQWDHGNMLWEFALGARYRDQEPERIEVGTDRIEKQWLFFPKIGWGGRF